MPVGALIGSAVIGAGASAYSANKAASAQKKAAAQSAQIQQDQYAQTRSDLAPYRDSGAAANTQYGNLMGLNGESARNNAFSMYQTDPSYQWQRNQAIDATQGSAAARGGLFSGATLKGISDRTQNIANLDYGNYVNRLAGLASSGQNAAAQTGQFGAGAANGMSNAYTNAGNATAGAYTGAANSFNNALSQGAGIYGAYRGGAFNTPPPPASSVGQLPNNAVNNWYR